MTSVRIAILSDLHLDIRRRLLLREAESEAAALAAFALPWHRVDIDPPTGRNALAEAISRLTGYPIPASTLERDVLSARVRDPAPGLDRLLAGV